MAWLYRGRISPNWQHVVQQLHSTSNWAEELVLRSGRNRGMFFPTPIIHSSPRLSAALVRSISFPAWTNSCCLLLLLSAGYRDQWKTQQGTSLLATAAAAAGIHTTHSPPRCRASQCTRPYCSPSINIMQQFRPRYQSVVTPGLVNMSVRLQCLD